MNAHEVAQQIVAKATQKRIAVCNLKLQKLLYYAQGYHLAVAKRPLFDNEIEAWDHGPVVNSVYFEYCDYGRNAINAAVQHGVDEDLPADSAQVIDFIMEKYARQDAWILRNQTHRESPWIRHQPIEGERRNEVIPRAEIGEFFSGELKKDFDSSLAALLDCSEVDIEEAIELPDSIQSSDQFLEWARSFK